MTFENCNRTRRIKRLAVLLDKCADLNNCDKCLSRSECDNAYANMYDNNNHDLFISNNQKLTEILKGHGVRA